MEKARGSEPSSDRAAIQRIGAVARACRTDIPIRADIRKSRGHWGHARSSAGEFTRELSRGGARRSVRREDKGEKSFAGECGSLHG